MFTPYSKIFTVFVNNKADYFNITGSGSAVYGIFRDIENSQICRNELLKFCPGVWITNTLAGKPLPD